MTYIKIEWHHNHPGEPILLYSELDEERWETRKIEQYKDGHCDFASKTESSGSTMLGTEPVPPNSEIQKQSEFVLYEIPEEEFEHLWTSKVQPQISK